MEASLGVAVLGLVAGQVPDDEGLVARGGEKHVGAVIRHTQVSTLSRLRDEEKKNFRVPEVSRVSRDEAKPSFSDDSIDFVYDGEMHKRVGFISHTSRSRWPKR